MDSRNCDKFGDCGHWDWSGDLFAVAEAARVYGPLVERVGESAACHLLRDPLMFLVY